jgi:hypothetical protein
LEGIGDYGGNLSESPHSGKDISQSVEDVLLVFKNT